MHTIRTDVLARLIHGMAGIRLAGIA